MDTQAIRNRIKTQGWQLRELPIQRTCPETQVKKVAQWKIIAFKGQKSVETSGTTIDDAIKNIGRTLGVIPKE